MPIMATHSISRKSPVFLSNKMVASAGNSSRAAVCSVMSRVASLLVVFFLVGCQSQQVRLCQLTYDQKATIWNNIENTFGSEQTIISNTLDTVVFTELGIYSCKVNISLEANCDPFISQNGCGRYLHSEMYVIVNRKTLDIEKSGRLKH